MELLIKKTLFGACYQILVSPFPHLNCEVVAVCTSSGSCGELGGDVHEKHYHSDYHIRTLAVSATTDAEFVLIVITAFPNQLIKVSHIAL